MYNNNIVNKFGLEKYGRGTNAHKVTIGRTELYFSYSTIIAIYHNGQYTYCENIYSSTTGGHMSAIPGDVKENRVDVATFEEVLKDVLKDLGL